MCAYGKATHNLTPSEVDQVFQNRLNDSQSHTLVLDVYGSILDEREMPGESFDRMLYWVARMPEIRTVIFETRPETISQVKINCIKSLLRPDQKVGFELGVETYDEKERRNRLGKNLSDQAILDAISLAQQNGCFIDANVLIGVPFLSVPERIVQSIRATERLIDNGCADVILFPINLKRDTVLFDIYRQGLYEPVSHWEIISVLSGLRESTLDAISLVYYGNKGNGIKPSQCPECVQNNHFGKFYREFLYGEPGRRALLNKLTSHTTCECAQQFKDLMSQSS
ncbi:hypothetical protein FACS189431_3720 [Alphaproteobacteria bacterium]|nr:hypothetical protein FACS189431_3720 [Alphaproteobacteria bacterium]